MSEDIHAFSVGAIEAWVLPDGQFNYPAAHFFANAEPEALAGGAEDYAFTARQVRTPYHVLYLEIEDEQILIDAGAGPLGAHAEEIFPDLDHSSTSTGHLPEKLAALGTAPSEIDTIILTHAHPDHIGGLVDENGELVFGQAEYYISETEWSFWFSEEAEETPPAMRETARQNLGAIEDRVRMIDPDAEIRPGIQAIKAPGHTPGHRALLISSEGDRLVHMADLVLHPLLMNRPDWACGFDLDSHLAAQSRELILSQVAGTETPVLGYHMPPSSGLGYVQDRETGWGWQPVETASSP